MEDYINYIQLLQVVMLCYILKKTLHQQYYIKTPVLFIENWFFSKKNMAQSSRDNNCI